MTALDLTSRPDGWIRKEMGVGGLKTVRELRGEDCIGFDDMPQPKQTTMVSRSFGTEVRDYDELANAIAMFATDASRSIRRGQSRRLVDERVHRDQPFRQEPAPRSLLLGSTVASDQ